MKAVFQALKASPRPETNQMGWIETDTSLPPVGEVVHTKIDDALGCRNEQQLKRGGTNGRLWFFPDG